MTEFIFKTQHSVFQFEIKHNGKHWTSYQTLDAITNKDKIIEKAISDLKEEGVENPKVDYRCPYW